jgi:hypothetical protein
MTPEMTPDRFVPEIEKALGQKSQIRATRNAMP